MRLLQWANLSLATMAKPQIFMVKLCGVLTLYNLCPLPIHTYTFWGPLRCYISGTSFAVCTHTTATNSATFQWRLERNELDELSCNIGFPNFPTCRLGELSEYLWRAEWKRDSGRTAKTPCRQSKFEALLGHQKFTALTRPTCIMLLSVTFWKVGLS